MKLYAIIILIIALLSTTTMAKRPKGVSAREMAASKAGGKLDYKTGKISVPKPQVSRPKSSTSGIGPVASGQEYGDMLGASQGNFVGPYSPSFYDNATKGTEYDTQKQDSKPLRKREQAAKAFNAKDLIGQTAQASTQNDQGSAPSGVKPVPVKSGGTTSGWRNMLNTGLDVAKNAGNILTLGAVGKVDEGMKSLGFDLTDTLGIPRAKSFGDEYTGQQAITEQQNFFDQQNDLVDSGVVFDENNRVDIAKSNQNLTDGWKSPVSSETNRPKPKSYPSPTNNLFTNPQTTDSLGQGMSMNDGTQPVFESNPNPSPIVTPSNTVKRPFGNGSAMSNGLFSNGKGYSGLEGASLGVEPGQDSEGLLDNLLTTLGIKPMTAQAQEMPQQPMSFNAEALSQSLGGTKINQNQIGPWADGRSYLGQGQQEAPAEPRVQAPGGSQTGGVAQQYAQPNQKDLEKQYGINQYSSMIKDTEKANKAAQRDLAAALQAALSQINNQYAQSQTEGTDLLAKQKQEDDLKLSGLFNFANQDPNSEQRMQYQQRGNQDAQAAIASLIAKITQGRTQDTLGAQQTYNTNLANVRQQGVNSVNQLRQQKASAMENLQNYIYKMKQDQETNRIASAKAGGNSKLGTGRYEVLPNGQFVHIRGSEMTPVSADRYMAGKFGLGIAGNETPISADNPPTDEELQAIVDGY